MKDHPTPSDYAALIGIDWADKKHNVCEIPLANSTPDYSVITTSPKAISDWAINLKSRHPYQQVAVDCELTKEPLIYALEQFDHIVLFPINPSTVAKFRSAFSHIGAKDDPSDALLQAQLLQSHMPIRVAIVQRCGSGSGEKRAEIMDSLAIQLP